MITSRESPNIHVSGHAHWDEVELLVKILSPEVCVPIHGSFTHIASNALKIEKLGSTSAVVLENHHSLVVSDKQYRTAEQEPTEYHSIDANSQEPLGADSLNERKKIGRNGLIIFSGVFSVARNQWAIPPKIQLIGLEPYCKGIDIIELLQDVTNEIFASSDLDQSETAALEHHIRKKVQARISSALRRLFVRKIPSTIAILVPTTENLKTLADLSRKAH